MQNTKFMTKNEKIGTVAIFLPFIIIAILTGKPFIAFAPLIPIALIFIVAIIAILIAD